MKKIIIATSNKGKVRELKDEFRQLDVELVPLSELEVQYPEPVEDGKTFAENSLIKAKYYQERTGCACLADDSGLEVDLLGGAPGVYSARYSGEHDQPKNNKKLAAELEKLPEKESPAAYQCALTFVDEDGAILAAQGYCRGIVKPVARGNGGFGYDPYFYIGEKTMAELTLEEKQAISHRGAAIREMAAKLKERL